jgi:hypothetical protein
VHVFGHGVDAHVGLVVAGFACGGDGADAVCAHVGQRHWRAWLAPHTRLFAGAGRLAAAFLVARFGVVFLIIVAILSRFGRPILAS